MACGTIATWSPMLYRNRGDGLFMVITTSLPLATTLVSGPPALVHRDCRSSGLYFLSMSNVNTTSAGVIGVPLLHLTPWRIVKVSWVLLEFHLYAVASHGVVAPGASGFAARLFTKISGSYTGPKLHAMLLELNGLKSQGQVVPPSSLMVSVLALPPDAPEDFALGEELLLLLQAAASSPAAASAAVRAVHLEVRRLMWAFLH